jgi:hypothetical protein
MISLDHAQLSRFTATYGADTKDTTSVAERVAHIFKRFISLKAKIKKTSADQCRADYNPRKGLGTVNNSGKNKGKEGKGMEGKGKEGKGRKGKGKEGKGRKSKGKGKGMAVKEEVKEEVQEEVQEEVEGCKGKGKGRKSEGNVINTL